MLDKIKIRWGLKTNWDIIAVMVVFSISGFSILFVRPIWFKIFGVSDATPMWLKFIIWLVMVFPTYQLFLLLYGFIFGQFKFFWEKEKKMVFAIGRLFNKSPKKEGG
jgi:hypothetical protein